MYALCSRHIYCYAFAPFKIKQINIFVQKKKKHNKISGTKIKSGSQCARHARDHASRCLSADAPIDGAKVSLTVFDMSTTLMP